MFSWQQVIELKLKPQNTSNWSLSYFYLLKYSLTIATDPKSLSKSFISISTPKYLNPNSMNYRDRERETHCQRCCWPCRGKRGHRIEVCERCTCPERNRVSNQPPTAASPRSASPPRLYSPWPRWTPPAPPSLEPPQRTV